MPLVTLFIYNANIPITDINLQYSKKKRKVWLFFSFIRALLCAWKLINCASEEYLIKQHF